MKADIDITKINKEILEIYLISQEENPKVNLTWTVKSFHGNSLVIILEFLNPEEISTGFKYDELVVNFKEIRDYFISKEHLVDLSEDSRTIKGLVPKLLS